MAQSMKWEWLGRAGHFIGSRSCLFHLHTHVNGKCVSTVGEYYPIDWVKKQPMEIGYNRTYETLIGVILPSGEIEGDVVEGYKDYEAATAGHMRHCVRMERGEEP